MNTKSNLVKYYLMALWVFYLPGCSKQDKPQPKPPSDYALAYQNDHIFEDDNDQGLITWVPDRYSYKTPLEGKDCNKSKVSKIWYWELDGEDQSEDFLELTISDHLGIEPDNSRAYTLIHSHKGVITSYDLIAKQKSGDTNLHVISWRIFRNAKEDHSKEHGDGTQDAAPPLGEYGFPRAWKGTDYRVGGKWTLRPTDSFDLRGITARLHVKVDNGVVKVCH